MTQKELDKKYLQIAYGVSLGSFDTASNKKVGSILVKNNEIIGVGSRQVYIMKIQPYKDLCIHAEHIAIMEAGHLAKNSTLYCTLEPCTSRLVGEINALQPPKSCCELIIESGIKRVVYYKTDSFVGHGGKEILENAGIEVVKFQMDEII